MKLKLKITVNGKTRADLARHLTEITTLIANTDPESAALYGLTANTDTESGALYGLNDGYTFEIRELEDESEITPWKD